jgi:hypothetical protein
MASSGSTMALDWKTKGETNGFYEPADPTVGYEVQYFLFCLDN